MKLGCCQAETLRHGSRGQVFNEVLGKISGKAVVKRRFDPFWVLIKAVNREDKRTRCGRDRDFVIFERFRRYCDRYRC